MSEGEITQSAVKKFKKDVDKAMKKVYSLPYCFLLYEESNPRPSFAFALYFRFLCNRNQIPPPRPSARRPRPP